MNPTILVAPAAELKRQTPNGEPPGAPPGDFGPVLAKATHAPPDSSRRDGARTAHAEGAEAKALEAGAKQEVVDETVEGPSVSETAKSLAGTGNGKKLSAAVAAAIPGERRGVVEGTQLEDVRVDPELEDAQSLPLPQSQPVGQLVTATDPQAAAAPPPAEPPVAFPDSATEQNDTAAGSPSTAFAGTPADTASSALPAAPSQPSDSEPGQAEPGSPGPGTTAPDSAATPGGSVAAGPSQTAAGESGTTAPSSPGTGSPDTGSAAATSTGTGSVGLDPREAGADEVPAAPPAAGPSRPGAMPDRGNGVDSRRADPPALGWHRRRDLAGAEAAGAPQGRPAGRPEAPPQQPALPRQPAGVPSPEPAAQGSVPAQVQSPAQPEAQPSQAQVGPQPPIQPAGQSAGQVPSQAAIELQGQSQSQPQRHSQGQPQQPAQSSVAAEATVEPTADVVAPAPPSLTGVEPQQAVASDRAPMPVTEVPVRAHGRLTELADTARTVIRVAARDGATQAHITLHPAELGEVEIRLRYHDGGVSADVVADSRAAAQVLQQASSELRRSLEAQGLVVHDLDVRHGQQEERRALHEQGRHAGGRGLRHGHGSDDLNAQTIEASSLPQPAGAVDVLA